MTTYVSPLLAVGDAIYSVLQDPVLTALVPGGVQTDVPENPDYPFVWIEILHGANYGGLGTQPGRGSMPGINLRLHVFQSNYGTARDAQYLLAQAIALLFDDAAPLVADGYTICTGHPLPEIETIPLADQELNGVKVRELVANLNIVIEEL